MAEFSDIVKIWTSWILVSVSREWSKANVLPFPLFAEVEDEDIADYLRSEYLRCDYLENCEIE